jgi:hypothetical protein
MSHIHFLTVYQHLEKKRLGAECDGGYVFGDNIGNYDGYISAGVSDEESFSRDFIKDSNLSKDNCFAFDGTITDYPYEYTKDITFVKKNIGPEETETTSNLKILSNNYQDIFLKMDIEGGEYPWIESLTLDDLNHYKQIVIEFHGINDDSWNASHQIKTRCLQKLANTHYLIHAHGNNWANCHNINNVIIPDVIELTYIRKNILDNPILNTTSLPINNLDFKNNKTNPEINLNHPPFTFHTI